MYRIMVTLIILIIFPICQAPTLSDRQRSEKIEVLKRDQEWERFIQALGQRESGNQVHVINQINCIGKWQFSPRTLKYLGYDISVSKFRTNPEIFPEGLQKQILLQLFEINGTYLDDYIKNYSGLEIGGVKITRAGILAAAHLGGSGSVKLYLLSMGRINKKDINRTSIKHYLLEFSKFDIK